MSKFTLFTHLPLVLHICVGGTGWALVEIMAITWTNADLLYLNEIQIKIQKFHTWKCIWKCLLWNSGHFVRGGGGGGGGGELKIWNLTKHGNKRSQPTLNGKDPPDDCLMTTRLGIFLNVNFATSSDEEVVTFIDLRSAQVYCVAIFLVSQEVSLNFHRFLWVKLWVGWVGRGYTEISRYFPASWINWVTLVTKIKLLYSLRF